MATTITPVGGNTPAAVQLNQGLPTAANSQAPAGQASDLQTLVSGQPLSSGQAANETAAYNTGAQNLAGMQTSGARQSYVNNSNVPGLQGNYEDLAKQLFEYDKNLTPSNYSAITPSTNPSMPTDQSPLSLTMGALNAPNFNFTNPDLAISSQTAQKNNISDLLGTLNNSIAREFSNTKSGYADTVKSQQSALDSILKILDLNNQLTMSQNKGGGGGSQYDIQSGQLSQLAQELDSAKGKDSYVSPQTYQRVKQEAAKYGISGSAFDSTFDVYRNPRNANYGLTLTGTGEQKLQDQQQSGYSALAAVDGIDAAFHKISGAERAIGSVTGSKIGALTPNLSQIDSLFYNDIIGQLKSAVGGRVTQTEIQWLHNQLPGIGDNDKTAQQKIDNLKRNVASKLQNPDMVLGGSNTTKAPTPAPSGPTSGGFTIKEVK